MAGAFSFCPCIGGVLDASEPVACLSRRPPPAPPFRLLLRLRPSSQLVEQKPEAARYPLTRRQELVEQQFGVAVADPYRWLENDVRNDPEVRAWVTAQNQVTDAFLETLPLRDRFKARMTELYDYERFGVPDKKGGRYFYSRNDGLRTSRCCTCATASTAPARMLIDPNSMVGRRRHRAGRMARRARTASGCSTRSRTAAPTGAPSRCSTSPPASRPPTR